MYARSSLLSCRFPAITVWRHADTIIILHILSWSGTWCGLACVQHNCESTRAATTHSERNAARRPLWELITARQIIENGELIIIFRQLFTEVIYSQWAAYTSTNYCGGHAWVTYNVFPDFRCTQSRDPHLWDVQVDIKVRSGSGLHVFIFSGDCSSHHVCDT